jgi:hypothetical protein
VISLRIEVLIFKQHEDEPLDAFWDRFNDLITTGPDLAILDPILLQHFYLGLSKDDAQDLSAASRGAFLSLPISKARLVHDKIIRRAPCTSVHDALREEEKGSSPEQEQEALIAKSQAFYSQDLAINPEPLIPQNPLREEENPPLENPFEFMGNLIDFGRIVNSRPRKRPPSEHIPNPLKIESLRKCPYSHIGC